MRPGQNKRMRGRNRRGPNPLTRSFESNGPDVKIRGTAAHIAEKYVQLARDAHASGDPVAAENYLQHAEHYLRLIAAAQQQQFQAQQQATGGAVDPDEGYDGDDEFESSVMDRFTFRAPQAPQAPGMGDQPDMPRQDGQRGDYQNYQNGDQPPRHNRGQDNRGENRDRPYNDNRNRDDNRGRDFRRDRFDRQRGGGEQRFERPQPQPEGSETETALPSFITAPVRIPIEAGEQPAVIEAPEGMEATGDDDAGNRFPLRPRRRRRRGPRDEAGGEGEGAPEPQEAPGE